MFGFGKSKTKVENYANDKELKRGIEREAKNGYKVASVTAIGGRFKVGKALLTGGLGYFTPGGLKRGERYVVTFALV